jgi:hypothetical protein
VHAGCQRGQQRCQPGCQPVSSRSAEIAWVVALLLLGAYEGWAILTGHTTLSRAVWSADLSPYGKLLPLATGVLIAHFFAVDVTSILAFLFGFVGGGLFWHIQPEIIMPATKP